MQQSNKTIGIDLAKNVFLAAEADAHFHVTGTRRLSRNQFHQYVVRQPAAHIIMETCGTAHYWARVCQGLGHTVTLLPAQHVKPYVPRNKTDRNDAIALIEASRNPRIRPVPVKTEYQQAIQSLHRLREQWKLTRQSRINTLRGIMREFGISIPLGPKAAIKIAGSNLEHIPTTIQNAMRDVLEEITLLEQRMGDVEAQLKRIAKQDEVVQGFMQISGIGLLTATAMRAAVQSPAQFKNGRQLSAWLGITPREYSSGEKRYLGRISKRGDSYLRTLVIHGARSVMARIKTLQRQRQPLNAIQQWAVKLEQRVGMNKATVALANKLVRILWATWMHQRDFDGNYVAH